MSEAPEPIRLDTLPHERAKALLARGAVVYLSVNPIEYHGPHLPLDTDALQSDAMTRLVHPRLGQELTLGLPPILAEPLAFGANPAPGPGTVETSYRTLSALVRRRCLALAEMGARRVVITTFHGGPFHNLAIADGVRALAARGIPAVAPFNYLLAGMLTYRAGDAPEVFSPIADPALRERLERTFTDDYHAGFWETSLMLHFFPEAVTESYLTLPPCPEYRSPWLPRAVEWLARALGFKRIAAELHFMTLGLGWVRLRPFPGYTGSPHLANAASGAAFAKRVADGYVTTIRGALLEGKPGPAPILAFLKPVSLNGLLAP